MAKHDSRFSAVLKVKQLLVKKAQRELAVIAVDRERAEGKLSELEDTRNDAIDGAAGSQKGRAADLQAGRAFIDRLSRQIRVQERCVDEEKSRESRKRDELVEKSQSEEMIERLDRKRRDEANREGERKQQVVMDVVAHRTAGGKNRP
jgi:flagellar export protein FliJ